MFWMFVIFCVCAYAFVQLGAFSVVVGMFALGFKLVLVVLAVMAVVALWRLVFRRGSPIKQLVRPRGDQQ